MERGQSMWLDELPGGLAPRAALNGDLSVDVVVIGAGFTGLWTAYYLKTLDPSLSVLVIEREFVGFGASGRNGGWAVGELAAGIEKYARISSLEESLRLTRAVFDSVDEIGRVAAACGIDCGYAKGGTIRLARNKAQLSRQIAEVAHHHSLGFSDDDFRLLDPDDAREMCNATGVLGGIRFAHTAAVDPARLVTGLATACEDLGVVIVERTAAELVEPGSVRTDRGMVTASSVVQATEAYTCELEGQRRRMVPVYSRMIATEPLDQATLDEIGLHERPTFADDRYMVIYGQRTEDGRIAFGGRGVPYLFGSKIDPLTEVRGDSHRLIHEALVDLFPVLNDVEITHRWGGVLGVSRDWTPFVRYDRASGIGEAGGYVGEGVAPSNLAGRTLAELIVGAETERTDLPWVGHQSRSWEPEPFRWLGIRGSRRIMAGADAAEDQGRQAKTAIRLSSWLRGS